MKRGDGGDLDQCNVEERRGGDGGEEAAPLRLVRFRFLFVRSGEAYGTRDGTRGPFFGLTFR